MVTKTEKSEKQIRAEIAALEKSKGAEGQSANETATIRRKLRELKVQIGEHTVTKRGPKTPAPEKAKTEAKAKVKSSVPAKATASKGAVRKKATAK